MKIGARIIKTGIAIVLALLLARVLKIPTPSFAGVAAIFAIQPTIYRSYRTVIEQIQGNIIGALIAVVMVLIFGNSVFFVGLAAVLVIIFNLRLKTNNSITLSVVTVIAIMETQNGAFLQFAFLKFTTVLLGILSAFVVNLLFIPPKYETKLYYQLIGISDEVFKWIRISTRHTSENTHIKNDIQNLKDQLIKVEQLYLMYKEDREWFKRAQHAKARKSVVYRQMIASTKKVLEVLRKLNRYENQFHHMPEEFQTAVQEQLDYLVTQHEQIHLKYIRKVKASYTYEFNPVQSPRDLLNLFLSIEKDSDKKDEKDIYHMMALTSSIMEYEEHLQHLDTLISSFQSFHKEDEEIKVESQIQE
ncbi:FUSC family protein [Bacillus testis]|uniref:FUSC family protein n=1 Tax=Bacillus testis TaxID=1622072 RepID=UPI00067F391B|nr:aromatic acid exporter family protein [Bacillus testis]